MKATGAFWCQSRARNRCDLAGHHPQARRKVIVLFVFVLKPKRSGIRLDLVRGSLQPFDRLRGRSPADHFISGIVNPFARAAPSPFGIVDSPSFKLPRGVPPPTHRRPLDFCCYEGCEHRRFHLIPVGTVANGNVSAVKGKRFLGLEGKSR